MFRIARIRIRWITTNQQGANPALLPEPTRAPDSPSLRHPGMYNPQHLRVRVSWQGLDSTKAAATPTTKPAKGQPGGKASLSTPVRTVQTYTIPSSGRILGSFDMPRARLRVIWLGLASLNRPGVWTLGLLAILLLGLLAFPRLAHRGDTNPALDTENVVPAGLIADDIPLGNETIRMIHSPLDIGQAKDVFDNNLDTLMRGREANPLIMDLQFTQSQAIKGLSMDFGRMDFVIRVQVYGAESTKPVSYQGEYRQQPNIPHIDMDFVNGPDQVRRIYIEIEQLNPPDEVHIHVREVLFKR